MKQIESEWKLTGVKVERLGGALIAQVGQNFLYQARIVKQEESKEGIATICRLDSRQKEEAGNQPLPKSSQGLLPLLAPDSVLASAGKEDTPGYTVVFRIPEAPLPATAHFCAQLRDLGWRAFEAQPETSADRKTGVSTYCHDKTGFGLILSISPDTTNANITCASLSLF
ncbi:TPA: hypothetical protein DDW35_01390 [Candidatus Sumerlaeota bacterium]|nr:hypothetical protein [Candidatus Sumerlaeota bacterium]